MLTHLKIVLSFLLICSLHCFAGENDTKLYQSLTQGNIEGLRKLIENGVSVNSRLGFKGETVLMLALRFQKWEIVDYLLDKGADVNLGSTAGTPPLTEACQVGTAEYVKKLLAKGANADVSDMLGFTPLIETVQKDNVEIAEMLIKAGANVNSTVAAWGGGRICPAFCRFTR